MELAFILANASATTTDAKGGMWQMLLMMVLLIVVFYFFMIKPQQKRQKELQNFRDALKPGDAVVTAGGIHGTVSKMLDDTILITIAENVVINVDKASVMPKVEQPKQ